MKILLPFFFCFMLDQISMAQITELYKNNQTPTYNEIVQFYQQLDRESEYAKLVECGPTDIGENLQLFVIDADKEFDPVLSRKKNKSILLINNGIHPGEPDGIDACIRLTNELLHSSDLKEQLKHLTVCIILVYNIDGCLNRNSTTRVNQDGPEEFGFRGNAQNYDLNRDFIKCDALNAQSFAQIFHTWDPDVFVDTHVSNGADYQYVMTLIATQHSKLTAPLGEYLKNKMLPALYSQMDKAGFPMCPYVNEIDKIPDNGITGFLDLPRYSTGYAALFNTIGFMPETHMLKPYPQRVDATYELLKIYLRYVNDHAGEILVARNHAIEFTTNQVQFACNWELDKNKPEYFLFRGFAAKYKTSEISGLNRLYYERKEPFEKNILFYDTYNVTEMITAPKSYVIPKAWRHVIERLKLNDVAMDALPGDTMMETEVYYIERFETTTSPWEGHYFHSNVKIRKEMQKVQFHKGDYVIHVNQPSNRYIIETLEPQAPDSFFAWGFFDAVLMQKEWFSDYVFEDLAAEILKQDDALKVMLEEKKKTDDIFSGDAWAQLKFIFDNSQYREITYNRYPVFRLN